MGESGEGREEKNGEEEEKMEVKEKERKCRLKWKGREWEIRHGSFQEVSL